MSGKYGNTEKKLIFRDTAKRHAELTIKLREDKLNKTKFFQMCITAYLKEDPHMLTILDLLKEYEPTIQSKKERKKLKQSREEAVETRKTFALSDDEIDDLYDSIELSNQ